MRGTFTFIFICYQFVLVGQVLNLKPIEKANKEFENFGYSEALKFYQIALENTEYEPFVLQRIAECYAKLNQPSRSEMWYKKAIDLTDDPDPDVILNYAEALASNERYEEASKWYAVYGNKDPQNKRLADTKIATIKEKAALLETNRFKVNKADFNSAAADFSPAYYEDGIVFVSARSGKEWVQNSYNWDESSYLDFFYYDGKSKKISKSLLSEINSPYHDGPGEFFNANKSLVFTRNNSNNQKLLG